VHGPHDRPPASHRDLVRGRPGPRHDLHAVGWTRSRRWVRNLVASPRCTVEIGDTRFVGYGRVIEGTDEDEPARTLVHDKYAHGDDLASWRATALPVAIDLSPASGDA
jgi:hypothetical protein